MFCLDLVVYVDLSLLPMYFFGGSSWSCIDVVCVLLACRYMNAFSPCLRSLYLGEVFVLYVVVVKLMF
jgi:hypothetical protein